MIESKLIGLLKNCHSSELKLFEKYLKSPYFNTNLAALKMLQILRKAAPEYKEKKVAKKRVFTAIYPNKVYSDKTMSNLMSEVVKHLENFWIMEDVRKDGIRKKVALANSYYIHNIDHMGENLLGKAVSELRKSKPYATELYEQLLHINIIKHEQIESREQRNVEPNLQAIHDHLDSYFIVSKLKYFYKCKNFSGLTDHVYDIELMKSVMTQAESEKYLKYDAIQIYYHAVKTLVSFENDENFIALKQLLIEHSHKYAAEEVKDMILTARNFAIRRLNRGELHYSKEALDLYKLELSEGLLISEDTISDAHTRNVVLLALTNKDTEWALNFLTKYKRFISKETFTYCKASVKFGRNEYDEVLALIGKTSFSDPLLNLSVSALILKTHFEGFILDRTNYIYEDALEEHIIVFRKQLESGDEELTVRATFYRNLVDYVEKLFIMLKKDKLNNSAIKRLKAELKQGKQIAQKNWLVEKVDSLF